MFPSFLGVGGIANGCRGFTAALEDWSGCKNLGSIILEVLYKLNDSVKKRTAQQSCGSVSVSLEHDRMVEGAEQEEASREKSSWCGEAGGTIADNPRLGGLGSGAIGFCGEPGQSPKQPCLTPGWAELRPGQRGEMWDSQIILFQLDFPPCLRKTLLGGFQEGGSEPTSVTSRRLGNEMQFYNPAQDLPRRLQLLHNLKCHQEEDEEAEGDPEPTGLAPVDCAELPARKETFETIRGEKKPRPVMCVRQGSP